MSNMIIEHGAPTINTAGSIGQRYFDIDSGRIYECKSNGAKIVIDGSLSHPHNFVAVNRAEAYVNEYVWEEISDRTHYAEIVEEVVMERRTASTNGYAVLAPMRSKDQDIYKGTIWDNVSINVFFNGMIYPLVVKKKDTYATTASGDADCPFTMSFDMGYIQLISISRDIELPSEIEFGITRFVEKTKRLDSKYMPCDLMFKVGCTGFAHPKYGTPEMTKPEIVSGSLEAVLEKLANGELPVVKVQYIGAWDKNISFPGAYGGEFVCDTWLYGTEILFTHNIFVADYLQHYQIAMDLDDPYHLEMTLYPYHIGSHGSTMVFN